MTNKPLILHLETTTTVCSVALSRETEILAIKETDGAYTHAENLHLFIKEVLDKSAISPKDLHAVALSSGPGSYTGLRIGSSTAKGLCYALNIPFIAVSTLQTLAAEALRRDPGARFICPMMDAGRMEVYTAVFNAQMEICSAVEALVLDEQCIRRFSQWPDLLFAGPGVTKAKTLLKSLPGSRFDENLKPSAAFLAGLALRAFKNGDFTEIADFEPFYLKNFVAGKAKQQPG